MASTGKNRGGLCAIYVDGVKVTHSTNASLSVELSTRDVTSKDSSGWTENAEGLKSWSITGEFFFAENATEGFTHVYADLDGRTTVTAMYSSGVSGDKKYSGSAYVTSLSRSSGIDSDTETWSITLTGAGALTEGTV